LIVVYDGWSRNVTFRQFPYATDGDIENVSH
jgi:hypothetical protein